MTKLQFDYESVRKVNPEYYLLRQFQLWHQRAVCQYAQQ